MGIQLISMFFEVKICHYFVPFGYFDKIAIILFSKKLGTNVSGVVIRVLCPVFL